MGRYVIGYDILALLVNNFIAKYMMLAWLPRLADNDIKLFDYIHYYAIYFETLTYLRMISMTFIGQADNDTLSSRMSLRIIMLIFWDTFILKYMMPAWHEEMTSVIMIRYVIGMIRLRGYAMNYNTSFAKWAMMPGTRSRFITITSPRHHGWIHEANYTSPASAKTRLFFSVLMPTYNTIRHTKLELHFDIKRERWIEKMWEETWAFKRRMIDARI